MDSQYSFRKQRLFKSGKRKSPSPSQTSSQGESPAQAPAGVDLGGSQHPLPPPEPSTYIPVELGEGLHHVEAMHVHNGCVDGELGAGNRVKEKHRNPQAGSGEPLEQTPHTNSTRRGQALLTPRAGLSCIPAQLSPLLKLSSKLSSIPEQAQSSPLPSRAFLTPRRALPAPEMGSPRPQTGSALPAPWMVLTDNLAQLSQLTESFLESPWS